MNTAENLARSGEKEEKLCEEFITSAFLLERIFQGSQYRNASAFFMSFCIIQKRTAPLSTEIISKEVPFKYSKKGVCRTQFLQQLRLVA
jgi:hypothetical protein